jgi:transposase
MSPPEEKEFLEPFFDKARVGGILIVREIHQALEKRLGRKVALASAYNLLHRNGWRKLVPDKRHVEADVEAQANWKKNSRTS